MKAIKIFSCLILASLFTNVNAQLRVLSDGRVQAGTFMPNQDYDNIMNRTILISAIGMLTLTRWRN
jgi:hypothetical protein